MGNKERVDTCAVPIETMENSTVMNPGGVGLAYRQELRPPPGHESSASTCNNQTGM